MVIGINNERDHDIVKEFAKEHIFYRHSKMSLARIFLKVASSRIFL